MLSVTKIVKFDAAHYLPTYDGDCKNLHGHTWKVEVEVADLSDTLLIDNDSGMLLDFKDLKKVLQTAIIERYDHQCLNDRLYNPTAENLVMDILDQVSSGLRQINPDLLVMRVRLWESDTSFATWQRRVEQ